MLDALVDHDPIGLQRIIDTLITYGRELRTAEANARQLQEQEEKQKQKEIDQITKLIQTATIQRDAKQRQIQTIEKQIQTIQEEANHNTAVACPHCGGDISSLCKHDEAQKELIATLEKQKQ
jgi:hypothetical protein